MRQNIAQKKRIYFGIFILCVFMLSGLEVLAYQFKGSFSVSASICWLAAGGAYLVFSISVIYETIILDIDKKNFLSLGVLVFIAFALFWGAGDSRYAAVNSEAAKQIADGISSFGQQDFGYTDRGYGAYPMRQFLLLAVPSMILGRNPFALDFGFDFSLFLGFMLFYAGMRKYIVKKLKKKSDYTALVILGLFNILYFINYRNFGEQAIMPFALIMQSVGWLFLLTFRKSIINLIGFGWIAALLGTSYTPALAGWWLMLLWLGVDLIKMTRKRKSIKSGRMLSLIVVFIYIFVFGWCGVANQQ